ncbi:MAG: ABC transporter ATP-binding protein [Chloroflexi bacterium HGW-Chloroflexi-10]|nr:MAG: ABC transporter ATP-binding protein [Chloroflexi bacterium HGW-Chloroflexi-10]
MQTIIEMKDIIKVFPPSVVALDKVSADFRLGEIHAIVGENGAGKSTLMKVLYGLERANSGEILLNGNAVNFHDPGEAIARGIGMVHQEILLIPQYTVWENIVLGLEPVNWLGKIDRERARKLVQQKIDEFQFNLNPDALVEDISVAARQKVEILKLLYRNVDVLILDEPTAVLTPQEIPQLFAELRRLRDTGKTILFISHHLEEVLMLCDRITVMRKGKKIGTVYSNEIGKTELAQMMVGRTVLFTSHREVQPPGAVVLEIRNLIYKDGNQHTRLNDIQLQVQAGEIAGIAGVEGNGQFELVNCIMGLSQPVSGEISINGKNLAHADILERRRHISFVPQDRGKMGAAVKASITENVMMTHHRLNPRFTTWKGLVLNKTYARQFTSQIEKQFAVVMGSQDDHFNSLSGGNQQKVILGRELLLDTPFILLDQPTRGLDVGSIEYVHETILKMRSQQRAILLISADLEELFRIADRIIVLHRGEIAANLAVEETNIEEIGYLMLQGREQTDAKKTL